MADLNRLPSMRASRVRDERPAVPAWRGEHRDAFRWKRLGLGAALAAVLATGQAAAPRAAPADEEPRLIALLEGGAAWPDKETACVRLHRIGTERAVPALAALLADPQLSHPARYALESMPSPAAGAALISALGSTAGAERLGVVASLAVRREPAAVAALARLVESFGKATPDTDTAGEDPAQLALVIATAAALGEIDRAEAIAALERSWIRFRGAAHDACADALLRQASRRLDAGDEREARRLFARVQEQAADEKVRRAAFQGVVRSSDRDGLRLLIGALADPSLAAQAAALRLVPDLPLAGAGRELARLLPTLAPPRQAALLNAWTQRPEPPPVEVLGPLLESPSAEVRIAAIRALAQTGNGAVVGPLLEMAATRGPAQDEARFALAAMKGADVTEKLIRELAAPSPERQAEAARALAGRGERTAVEPLRPLAGAKAGLVRQAALRALASLVDEREVGALVRLVVEAADEATRAEAARAVALAYERLAPTTASPALDPLLEQLARGRPEIRVALLPVCRGLAWPEIRGALRAAMADPAPEVRAAAVLAACRTVDPGLLPDLTALARDSREEESREVATRACIRLVAALDEPATPRRTELFRALTTRPTTVAQRRALLTGLAAGRTLAELEIAVAFAADESVRSEALPVALQIAPRVGQTAPALALLQRLPAATTEAGMRTEIAAVRQQVQRRAGFVTSWRSASFSRPIAQATGLLIDAPFAPETDGGGLRVASERIRMARWEPMAAGTNARKPMLMAGGGPTVFSATFAYTWLHAEGAREAGLEVEHDSAVKVWANGTLVLAAAATGPRPQPAVGRGRVPLDAGWNLLLVKVAQPARPWSFSVRLTDANGKPLSDVVADAEAEPVFGPLSP